jgi:hypothetical protein
MVAQFVVRRFQSVPILAQVFLYVGDLLPIFTDLAPVAADFSPAGAVSDVLPQFGAILFQLFPMPFELLAISADGCARLPNFPHVLANFAIIATITAESSTVAVISQVVVTPASVAPEQQRAPGNPPAENPAISGRRLMARRAVGKPDAAFAGGRQVPRRNTKLALAVSVCGRGGQQSPNEKSAHHYLVDVFHVVSPYPQQNGCSA